MRRRLYLHQLAISNRSEVVRMTRSQLMQKAKEKGLKRKDIHKLETPELRQLVRNGQKPFYE
jgi:hypothetical protein